MGVLIFRLGFPMLVAILLLLLLSRLCSSSGFTFHLERAFPLNKHVNVTHHVSRDKARHGRLLHSSGAIDFPVRGDVYQAGLYYSKVSLGTPPKDFYVQIDTGSENMWVSCSSCKSCPTTSPIQEISLNFYDPNKSSTSSLVTCQDERCRLGVPVYSSCSTESQRCVYSIKYYDESRTSGFYVSDLLNYNTRAQSSRTSNHSTAPVVFGCSNVLAGNLAESVQLTNGIFGFGQHGLSVISQLASHGNSPKAFSHCLRGDAEGGGVLVLGEIVEPDMVFSPLIRNQNLYTLNLCRISVNGKTLAIDPALFSNEGALIDSGTTMAYLPHEVYKHFISAINDFIGEVTVSPNQCYLINSSVSKVFPSVNLIFEGEAVLMLSPEDYLVPDTSFEGDGMWCMGFGPELYTVLGDLVLRNKIFVYDLVNQRIGWKSYNCSKDVVNVTTTIEDMHSDAWVPPLKFTPSTIASILVFFFFWMD